MPTDCRFRLTLMGEGAATAELKMIEERHEAQICVRPPVPHDQVPQVLAQAHVGVLPFPDEHKFQVSSPIKLFEYMAAGLPVLATRISCHTDVIGNQDYVFWIEGADVPSLLAALQHIPKERDRLSAMGTRASLAARAWSWQASAGNLKTALQRILTADVQRAEPRQT